MAGAALSTEQPVWLWDLHQQAQESEKHTPWETTFMLPVQWHCFSLIVASLQCRLHIHASYSTTMKMNVPMLPLSQPNAVGLVLAHGKRKNKQPLTWHAVVYRRSCLCLQEVLETQNRFSPLTCMCLMMAATRGWWPSKAPIITLYWIPEACWWLWSTPTSLSIRSSQLDWE